jgi:hypothetical protein
MLIRKKYPVFFQLKTRFEKALYFKAGFYYLSGLISREYC